VVGTVHTTCLMFAGDVTMRAATRMILIRHAAIDTHSRLCGSLDVPLSAAGRARLHALLRRRRAHARVPDVLFTSTLRRAVEVARELGRAWDLEPRPTDWAREIDCGEFEGMPLQRLQGAFPALWSRNHAQVEDTFAWPGGESYIQFRARVLSGLAAAADAYRSGRVAVVTHAGVIAQVLGVIKGRAACVWEPDRPDPLTATEVLWENCGPRAVLSFNDPDWY
jgi:alpha-ribazole phosphatase/probable phosphoglycerate mutase